MSTITGTSAGQTVGERLQQGEPARPPLVPSLMTRRCRRFNPLPAHHSSARFSERSFRAVCGQTLVQVPEPLPPPPPRPATTIVMAPKTTPPILQKILTTPLECCAGPNKVHFLTV